MKFVALIYAGEREWDELSDDDRTAIYARYRALFENDKVIGGDELASTATATTVRVREGEALVTDGPFVETKEALGGYFVFDCDSMEEALDLAAQIPAAETGAVEVRACHVDEEAEQARESEEVVA